MGDETEYLDDGGWYYAEQDYRNEFLIELSRMSDRELVNRIKSNIDEYNIFKVDVKSMIIKIEKYGWIPLTQKQREFLELAYTHISLDK